MHVILEIAQLEVSLRSTFPVSIMSMHSDTTILHFWRYVYVRLILLFFHKMLYLSLILKPFFFLVQKWSLNFDSSLF